MNVFLRFFFLLSISGCATQLNVKDYHSDKFFESISKENQDLVVGIQTNAPELFTQIQKDANDEILKNFWGHSLNFDSGAKSEILDLGQMQSLAKFFNVSYGLENKSIHAGVMHTYGYLFSTLNTPYGFKRSRWIAPDLKEGFNLLDQSLSANPKEGTLLNNLTYFMGKIAFKTKEQLASLEKLTHVSSEIKNFPYKKLEIVELEEKIAKPESIKLTLRTYLVRFFNSNNLKNQFALIYGIEDATSKEIKLITLFPINRESYLKTIDSNLLGKDRPILIRYNAFIGQTKDDRYSGDRVISGI